ncbi:SRPBCC family protein [Agrococcus sp. SGAir0287]|uniref:SRPBCC family protein n=1 Tax=Agrococcus sp. SGAir0287 TaxID=2070347 RepID=UPI0010CCE544|nr:SRPBCC family protein [Agrococcus sp. SGAir0287]QCR18064.1 cyclase [Agrococcus sp. SGAir0287]
MATITEQVDVRAPISSVYGQWTQFESFPRFMDHVERIEQLGDDRLRWHVRIGGQERDFEARITEQHPDERIAWAADGDVTHAGVVTFHRVDDDTTRVALQLDWEPEGFLEKVGAAVGIDDASVRGDLARFKTLIESEGAESGRWDGDIDRDPDATGR